MRMLQQAQLHANNNNVSQASVTNAEILTNASAEDLLRLKTIPELRNLISSLDEEASSKQTELQLMVGSKYHDFIQSADSISQMQQSTGKMEKKLEDFWGSSKVVVNQTKDLLLCTTNESSINNNNKNNNSNIASINLAHQNVKINQNQNQNQQSMKKISLSNSAVWERLEECDVYGAVNVIVVAALLLQNTTCSENTTLNRLSLVLSSEAKQLLQEWSSPSSPSYSSRYNLLLNCNSAIFLSQTVEDDARLVLLDENCTPMDTARTLASLGLLSGLHRGDLLKLFLEGADLLIEAATEGLDDPSLEAHIVATKLTSAVLTMQQTILDAYFLFFRPTPTGDNVNNITPSSPSLGLLSVYQENLLQDIENQLQLILFEDSIKNNKFFDMAEFAASNLKNCSNADARNVFDKWLANAVQRVGHRSATALEAMKLASDVAKLQQRVWQCSTTILNDDGKNNDGSAYTQSDWEAACKDLLAPKRRRMPTDKSSLPTEEISSSLLWSTVFRAPFVRQVERLLRESCRKVLVRTKSQLLSALSAEGVSVDPETMAVSVNNNVLSSLYNVNSTPAALSSSPRLFRRAETLRSLLEMEVMDLVSDIVLPTVQEGDPQSAASLSRALLIQCSQLAGQLAVMLRVISTSCNSVLDARLAGRNSTQVSSKKTHSATKASFIEISGDCALTTGLLLLGRFAWLLKIRGRFLEDALSSSVSQSDSHSIQSCDLTSEEQLRSAFEIADTDGDGIVTYSEALEAIQALAINDTSFSASSALTDGQHNRHSSSPSSYPFLSAVLTPSLTFGEITLLCAHLLPPEVCAPASRLKACVEEIIATTHMRWAEKLVQELARPISDILSEELGISSLIDKNKTSQKTGKGKSFTPTATFKSSWRKQYVEMDTDFDTGDSVREQLSVPVTVSTCLNSFLFSLSHRTSAALLSIDTVQQLPPLDALSISNPAQLVENSGKSSSPDGSGNHQHQIDKLAQVAFANANNLAIRAIASTYTNLLRDATAAVGSSLHGGMNAWLEDCSLQAYFDLLVCEGVATRCGVTVPKPLTICMNGWKSKMDPINAELLAPLLSEGARSFAAKTYLLLPGHISPSKTPKQFTSTADVGSCNMSSSSDSTFFSNTVQQTSRFALLPLPMSTNLHGSAWASRELNKQSRSAGSSNSSIPTDSIHALRATHVSSSDSIGGTNGKGKGVAGKSSWLGNLLGGQ